jgi:hypothetical protein
MRKNEAFIKMSLNIAHLASGSKNSPCLFAAAGSDTVDLENTIGDYERTEPVKLH